MSELAKEYPFIHIYAQQKPRQPVIIKANTEGLCVLLNAIVAAIAYQENNGTAEVFDGDAEVYEVVVKVVNTHDELSPVPYQISKS
ncbi:hypothetical protein [Nostoc sp. 'Peltigera membranacea cyanobiont' N6]|uniref:hypothetical protein n=1 Tax=Nostoc sp. 'Peltigera membranacea cyanobiont' N6 TaxID=1261031 RepID=UPI000CF30525|nr:hypothetical protein [Nostoc sp. 'Peltigera membranacea cyanobiont' N6]AVH68171.1 hypothetical protein NPM_10086 [Nostoc sp. 'Peltigera membranacea cyanobiont' N6]